MQESLSQFQKRFAKILISYFRSTEPLISLVAAILGIIASVVSTFFVKSPEQPRTSEYYVVLAIASVTVAVLTLLISIRQRGPSKIAKLKSDLVHSFLNALDSSPLNPRSKEVRDGQ